MLAGCPGDVVLHDIFIIGDECCMATGHANMLRIVGSHLSLPCGDDTGTYAIMLLAHHVHCMAVCGGGIECLLSTGVVNSIHCDHRSRVISASSPVCDI